MSEAALQEEIANLKSRFGRRSEECNDSLEQHDLALTLEDDLNGADVRLAFLSRSSALVSAYSLHEICLEKLCRDCTVLGGFHVEVSDMKGRGVQRSRLYLKKVARMPFPDDSAEWQRARHLGTIRNFVVHGGSELEGRRDRLQQALSSFDDASLEATSLRFEASFPRSAITCLSDFWTTLEQSGLSRWNELLAG